MLDGARGAASSGTKEGQGERECHSSTSASSTTLESASRGRGTLASLSLRVQPARTGDNTHEGDHEEQQHGLHGGSYAEQQHTGAVSLAIDRSIDHTQSSLAQPPAASLHAALPATTLTTAPPTSQAEPAGAYHSQQHRERETPTHTATYRDEHRGKKKGKEELPASGAKHRQTTAQRATVPESDGPGLK